jgi:Smad anchor for receptor activation (SARA)-like protein
MSVRSHRRTCGFERQSGISYPPQMRFPGALLLLALTSSATASAETRVIVEKVLVPNELSVKVWAVDLESGLGGIPAWIYVSHGLVRHRQREVVIGVKREAGDKIEAPPADIFALFTTIDEAAVKMGTVNFGDRTQFGRQVALLGDRELRCVLYLPGPRIQGVDIPDGALLGSILPCDEIEAATTYGPVRLMMRLGVAAKYQPTPPFTDRKRAERQADNSGSLLNNLRMSLIKGLTLVRDKDGKLWIRLALGAAREFGARAAALRPDEPLGLFAAFDPTADSYALWRPNHPGPEGVSLTVQGSGMRIGLNFIAFAPNVTKDDFKFVEDGVMMSLTNATWQKLRQAIENRETLSLPSLGGGVEVVRAEDPVVYYPAQPAPPRTGPVQSMGIVLVTPDYMIMQRLTIDDMKRLIDATLRAAEEQMTATPTSNAVDVAVHIDLDATHMDVHTSYRPRSPATFAPALEKRLAGLQRPKATGEVSFQVWFSLNGGTGQPPIAP